MQRVRTTTDGRLRHYGRPAAAVAAGVVGLITLAACTAGTGTNSDKKDASAGASQSSSASSSSAPKSASPVAAAAVISVNPASAGKISPSDPVSVKIANGTLSSVKMTNPQGKVVKGAVSSDGSTWTLGEDLGYDKTYKISAAGHNADGIAVTKTASVTTLHPNNMTMPSIENIYGTGVGQGQTYGVGMVFRVHFDESVDKAKAQRNLKVTTTPAVTGGWYWSDDQNAYWRPQSYYAPNTKVSVAADVYGKEVGKGLYGQDDKTASFTIGEKRVSIADAKTHHVKVYFSDKQVRNMPTSMGQGGTTQGKYGTIYLWTMPGTYTVINHENPATMSSDSYGLSKNSPLGYAAEKVPWATKISTDGIYLHELDSTVGYQGHSNVSHGCLNLNYKNAKWYYEHARVGDVVQVVHSGGPKITFNQGGQWSMSWADWQKGSAL
jgi:lipoprotein-anchoring transpeptidase ErfK/SrfK